MTEYVSSGQVKICKVNSISGQVRSGQFKIRSSHVTPAQGMASSGKVRSG